jgi:hypothetical protein
MPVEAPTDDEPYCPDRVDERAYDDRAGEVIEDALRRGSFLVREELSRSIGFSGRDPAEEAL